MDQAVYTTSWFWQSLHWPAELAPILGPLLLVVGALLWLFRERSTAAAIGAAGALLAALANVAHVVGMSVTTVGMPYPQPAVGENALVVFVYLYGGRFGLVLLGVGLTMRFLKARHAAHRRVADARR
jgi:membrane-bound metal-dependent hydrolase YbcI (DUF457 family)